jgi:hypothetical protein
MKRLALVSLVLIAVACGSGGGGGSSNAAPGRPELQILQKSPLFFGSGRTAPLTLEVFFTNRTPEPVVVRRVRVEPWSMTQYAIYPAERLFKETVAPGETRSVLLNATAYTNLSRLRATEPLSVRATLDYDYQGKRYRALYIDRAVAE